MAYRSSRAKPLSAFTGAAERQAAYARSMAALEVVTSERRFWIACPCASLIVRRATELLGPEHVEWHFEKAIVRPMRTSALFVREVARDEPHELWVSASLEGSGDWTLRNTPLVLRGD